MKWDVVLRIVGIAGLIVTYYLYLDAGQSPAVLFAVCASIIVLIAPEAIDKLPYGPTK